MNEAVLNLINNAIIQQDSDKVIIIGIHGPQGIGKTTLNKYLKSKLDQLGHNVLSLSIDDFYLPQTEMNVFLSNQNSSIYKYRGLSGTHDVDLLYNTLVKLKNYEKCEIPIFDKNVNYGLGDRVGFKNIINKPNIILLEGWMLGYTFKINLSNKDLSLFNKYLVQYESIQNLINKMIYLEALDNGCIIPWRWSAESKDGMDYEKFLEFMNPYMLIYNEYEIVSDTKIILDKNRNIC